MDDDITTIRLSADGDRIVRELEEGGWFATQVAAFEAAVAVAIAFGLAVDNALLGDPTTKWNVGTLDPLLRDAVVEMCDGPARPYEEAMLLAEAGLRRLEKLITHNQSLMDVVLPQPGSSAQAVVADDEGGDEA